jgi:hypothetical protein
MNTIKSRFERFAAFAFTSSSNFDNGVDLWDTISHYEFYLNEGEPNETFLKRLESLGCSRRWLLYASGEMFADNEQGRILRRKFMQGEGIGNMKRSFDMPFTTYVPTRKTADEIIEETHNNRTLESKEKPKAKSAGKARRVAKKK